MFRSSAIKYPFQRIFSAKMTLLVVATVYIISLVTSSPYFYYNSFRIHQNSTNHRKCKFLLKGKPMAVMAVSQSLIGTIVPMIVIIIIQVRSHLALKQSGHQFGSNANRIQRMKKVNRTFLVVACLFFGMAAPAGVLFIYKWVMYAYNPRMISTTIFNLSRFFHFILSLNCCANPIIYAKIHRRIAPLIRSFTRQETEANVAI